VLLLGPRVAFEPGGTALVAWNHCTSFQSCPRLEGLTLDPGGSPSPKVMVANGLNLPPAPMVSLLVRSPGEFSVVYPEDLAGSISVLWHQRLDAGALPLGAATPLDRGQAISGRLIPGIDGAYLPDGRHLITLRYGIDTGSVGVFSNDSILALQRFEPDGTPLGNQAW
jgi:hypothetical protein